MVNSGRPDLIHIFILQYHHIINLLPEENKKKIKLFIHTKNDEFFQVPSSWRVPVHFIRFRGLMEKFLVQKSIKFDEQNFLHLLNGSINDLINKINPKLIINLTDTGAFKNELLINMKKRIIVDDETIFLIGGYQKGEIDLAKTIIKPLEEIKLVDKPTTSWIILNILLTGLIIEK